MDDCTLSLKSLEDYGVSSVIWRFSNCRSTDVTFFVLESNGLWRVLVLPQQYLYRRRSLQSNVNRIQVGSLLPLTSFLFGREKIQRVFNIGSPLESISSRSSLHDGGAFSNLKKWDMLSIIPSGQNPIIECEFPGTISRGSDANSVENMDIHDPKENRSTDRYSRKKPRKKGKRNRNLKCSNGLNELQSAVGCSITQAVIQSIQHRSISSSANMSNSLMTDAMTLSSIALASSSDERCSSGGCKSPHTIVSTEVSSTGDILNSAGERKKRSKQHVGNPYVTEKKDKYFRRVPKDSNVYASSTGNQNSHARKENYHCIWKRVQKNDADANNRDLEKLNLGFSQFDDRLKKSTLKKELPNRVDSIILSQSAHENQEKLKVPKNPRRNKCLDPLEENESQCQKGSPVNGASSNVCLTTNTQSDDVFGSATQIASAKRSINAADSRTGTSSFRDRYKKRNVQYVSLKPIPNPKACSRNVEATGDVPIVVSNMDDQMVEHQFDLLSRSEKFDDLTARWQELPAVDGEGDKADKEVSPSGQNVTHEQLASKCQAPVSSSVNVRVINAGQNSENIKALPGDTQFGKLRNHNTCTLEQGYANAATAKFFVPEAKSQTFHSLENDWRNISQAVNDAHRAQLASKAIEIGNGYPAAEFEKLLHSASPFICASVSIRTCRACLRSQATNDPLCRHEIPNISLENLWQWYEKHGSYGLEVKTEDHRNARHYGMDHSKFRAYFVPYLSAIQLFKDHRTRPIHNDNRTLGSSGTGLVHTAPGHGQEDYVTGLKYGLPIVSPVDDVGKFTEEAGQFRGLDVLGNGNVAVIDYLDEQLSLVMVEPYKHKYPYDWRTKKPTIFRATEQWFASVEGFRDAAMDAINQVTWTPTQAVNRISAMTSGRSDWCISRQRTWGVPIPVFYHVGSKEPLMNEETVDHIKSIISQKGSDAWWYMSVEELLPEKYCDKASNYEKGTDTMDVWFDSGSSWAAVLDKRESLNYPADLYLEGTDQHRGWFQSSLLTSIATKGMAPYRGVITHGFVLDERGLKMSKSLGNVVDPRMVIEGGKNQKESPPYSADVLRLWVSSVDYTGDVLIGPQVLRQMSDIYRKLRGTLRFLLANLHDWKADCAVPYSDLPMIDQYALFQLANVVNNIRESYENYQFFKIFQVIQRFVIVDLSNFYLDVAKDRLYVGGSTSFTRRGCQTVLEAHLLSIGRIIAPILPHLAEDVWQHLPFQHTTEDGHVAKYVFESRWPELDAEHLSFPEEEVDFWGKILELRTEVNKALEVARNGKLIGSSLEAKVYLYCSNESLAERLKKMCKPTNDADALNRIFITSQVEILNSLEDERIKDVQYNGEYLIEEGNKIWIGVSHADGSKCDRCWNYSPQVGSFTEHPLLCGRCHNVVIGLPIRDPEDLAKVTQSEAKEAIAQ